MLPRPLSDVWCCKIHEGDNCTRTLQDATADAAAAAAATRAVGQVRPGQGKKRFGYLLGLELGTAGIVISSV